MKNSVSTLIAALVLACPLLAEATQPTQDMRDLARLYATLDARDQVGFCIQMQTPAYAGYIGRACELSVRNRLKRPEDCTPENTAKQTKADEKECLAMKPAEFEEKIKRALESKAVFLKEMAEQGIDGEKLLQEEERQRARDQALREYEKKRGLGLEACCAKPDPGKPRRSE